MAHSLLCFFQCDELKFAEDQVLCTTLSYDAFTDGESMIGDAIRIQSTTRSMPAACSLTRTWSKAPAPRSRVTGSGHLGTHSESRDTVLTPAEVTDTIMELENTANNQGNRTTLYLSPSWISVEFGLVSLVSQERARPFSGLA